MGKSGRNYRERGKRNDGYMDSMNSNPEEPGSMNPNFEPEKFDDIMDIYTDTDYGYQNTDCYSWVDEEEDDI
jgi:hypothetical protein